MLCCVSRKASARPNNQSHQQNHQQKPIDSDCSRSSSGFSESSSASSGDFASSGFSATSSSSSTTSGFSSNSPPSLCAFSNSSTSGSEFSDRFDVQYLDNRSNLREKFNQRAFSPSFSSNASSKDFGQGVQPVSITKRFETFSTPDTNLRKVEDCRNVESILGKEKCSEDEPATLSPCAICARTFLPQSLEKHTRICEKSAIKKRKPFDSAKQRIQGTEIAEFLPKETIKRKIYQEEKSVPTTVSSKGSWKQTHDEFLRAIRAARGDTIDVPVQRQLVASSQVTFGVPTRPNEKGMCPTCNRQFSIKSYERHVAWCKDHATRQPLNAASNVAKERLEARMNYRAPLLKNRKLTNRDKYSPGSAVNLPNNGIKNTPTNNRAKESVSTPNCINNSKGGNDSMVGSSNQYHQKPTANSSRYSGQSREGMSSGPIKSRPSDRSSRPSAEISSGPTTTRSMCPVPLQKNNRQSRFPPTIVIPSSNAASPLSTARSIGSRIVSQESESSSRRFVGNDRKSIELNIFDGSKYHQKLNIVSARSNGHPKVNDIAINDEVIGMTVQRCGVRKNNEKDVDREFVTWKQISEQNNLAKSSTQQIKLADLKSIGDDEIKCHFDSGIFGPKKLNQTYLIRESLDVETSLSQVLNRRIFTPVENRSRVELNCTTPRKLGEDISVEITSPSRFNAEVNITSSRLQSPESSGEDDGSNEKHTKSNREINPEVLEAAKFELLGLEMISNDRDSDQCDSSTSEATPLLTCRRTLVKQTPRLDLKNQRELISDNSLNLKSFDKRNCEHLFDDCHESKLDVSLNQYLNASGSERKKFTLNDNCNGSSSQLALQIISTDNDFDSDRQSSFEFDNEKNAITAKRNSNKSITRRALKNESVDGKEFDGENCKTVNSISKEDFNRSFTDGTLKISIDGEQVDFDKQSTLEIHDEKNTRNATNRNCAKSSINREEFSSESQLNFNSYYDKIIKSKSEDKSLKDFGYKMNIDCENQISKMFSSPQLESAAELKIDESLDSVVSNNEISRANNSSKKIEDTEFKKNLNPPRTRRLKKKRRAKLRDEQLHSESQDDEITKANHCAIGNIGNQLNTEDNIQVSETLISFERTETLAKTLYGSLMKSKSSTGKNVLDSNSFESSDVENYLALIDNKQSSQEFNSKIDCDGIFEPLDTPRPVTTVITPMNTSNDSSPTKALKSFVETDLSFHKSVNYDSQENDDCSINLNYPSTEVKAPEKVNKKNISTDTLEMESRSSIEKSFNNFSERSKENLEQPIELFANYSEVEKIKETAMEQPKNYRRCGTYVIERSTDSHVSTKHSASDESLKEKPLLKKRRTEQFPNKDETEKTLMYNKALTEKTSKDIKSDQDIQNVKSSASNSPIKLEIVLKSKNSKNERTDRSVHEIYEKYVNCNFDYDSDNTGVDNNLVMESDPEASKNSLGKLSCGEEMSRYELQPKAFSDSIVPRKKSSGIPTLQSQQNRVAQDPSVMKKKLKKKMTLLRGSIETLISSMEASGGISDDKLLGIVDSYDINTRPQVVEEAVEKLDLQSAEKITACKTNYCGLLPEISIDRVSAKSSERNPQKLGLIDGLSRWEKPKRNSNTRLINLDLPNNKCQDMRIVDTRQSNIGIFPVFAPSYRKEKRRGICKDYDPFLLAERQMNELLSDTCSDQSFTDSPANRRRSPSPSAPNYPLSHSSAFAKYPDPLARNLKNVDKRTSVLAPPMEFDDSTGDFSSDSTETNSISREMLADLGDSRARENGFDQQNKSNHVFGRRVIIDKSKALGTNDIFGECVRKNSQTNEKARKILDKMTPKVVRPQVTRSSSVRANSAPKAPERKNNNLLATATNKINSRSTSGSGLTNRNNNYTSLSCSNGSLSSIVSSEIEVKRSNSLFDELVSSFEDDASGSYTSLGSLLKNDSLSSNSPVQQSNRPRNGQISDDELLSSPDSYQRQDNNKLSADSAYSSLNRKYSNHGRSANDSAGRLEEDSPQRRRESEAGLTSSAKHKLSKFCHECGCKFSETAKFCCECGIKRLTL